MVGHVVEDLGGCQAVSLQHQFHFGRGVHVGRSPDRELLPDTDCAGLMVNDPLGENLTRTPFTNKIRCLAAEEIKCWQWQAASMVAQAAAR